MSVVSVVIGHTKTWSIYNWYSETGRTSVPTCLLLRDVRDETNSSTVLASWCTAGHIVQDQLSEREPGKV